MSAQIDSDDLIGLKFDVPPECFQGSPLWSNEERFSSHRVTISGFFIHLKTFVMIKTAKKHHMHHSRPPLSKSWFWSSSASAQHYVDCSSKCDQPSHDCTPTAAVALPLYSKFRAPSALINSHVIGANLVSNLFKTNRMIDSSPRTGNSDEL